MLHSQESVQRMFLAVIKILIVASPMMKKA